MNSKSRTSSIDDSAFRAFERARHDQAAETYYDFFAPVTALAIEPLLTAVSAEPGCRLLDVACGPGVVTRQAAAKGALVCGVDLSPRMVALAQSLHSGIDFREGDVEALPFPDGSFDAVVCNFGIGHFPNAERAVNDCVRVLRADGRIALSWWDLPSRARLQGLFVDALQEVGATAPADLPAGPPIFRYSDDAALQSLFGQADLTDIKVRQFSHIYRVESIDTHWTGSMGSFARTSAMVLAQTPEMQQRIRTVYERLARVYADDNGLAMPVSFKVASGQRPG